MAINNFNVGVGTTSQLTRYRYVATGGETSISGTDADGKTLSYTVGLEQVFLNGVNLVRGQDYTATNGTSIGNLTALVASDSLEVFAYVPFNIANALTVSTVDAKGDLLVGTAADTVGRLAVGSTNDQTLVVDSSTASGLKWTDTGVNAPLFSAKKTGSTQTFSSGTWTKITFETETYDTNSCFDNSTNYRFTPNKAGYYLFNAHIMATTSSGSNEFICALYKNGSAFRRLGNGLMQTIAGLSVFNDCAIVYANGSSDYFECYGYGTGGTTSLQTGECYFEGHWARL